MMNERIKELEAQCWEHDQSWTGVGQRIFNSKKFAQLIVKECIQVCKNQEYEFWRSPEDREYTPQDCADSIAQHFGVKE